MRILIFGASGRTGRPLVEQALERGHEVTAFVRDPVRLALEHGRLRVVSGDVTDAVAVYRADLADFMLAQLEGDTHLGRMPMVSY